MLTKVQARYLLTIPEDKKVNIQPYDVNIPQIVMYIKGKIASVAPELEVLFLGASTLGISGQGDLDINILSPKSDNEHYIAKLSKVFNKPAVKGTSVKWIFIEKGHEVEMYITDPSDNTLKEQIRIFEILKSNKNLLKEYEKLKELANGLSFREYQRRKYEFYNNILSISKL